MLINVFIKETEIHNNWYALTISLLTLIYFSYQLIMLFRKGKVVFIENKFISYGKYIQFFRAFNVNCNDIINYQRLSKFGMIYLQFNLKNHRTINLHVMQFSKKQINQILLEIQNRGGLINIDIDKKF